MKIKTVGPVQHDGKNIAPGTIMNLPTEQATQLIDVGAAEAAGGAKAADRSTAPDVSADGDGSGADQ